MTHMGATTSLGRVDIKERGAAVKARREHLGMTVSALAELAEVDRGKLGRWEEGRDDPTPRWASTVERALDGFEAETGHLPGEVAKATQPALVRVRLEGVPGATAIVMEAAPENIAELVEAVRQIMETLPKSSG